MYIQQQISLYIAQLIYLINRYEDPLNDSNSINIDNMNANVKMILGFFESLHNACPDKNALKYEAWHKSLTRNINLTKILE